MAVEGEPVVDAALRDQGVMNIFYLSLALIIAGVGFLKANISAIVGELYNKGDERLAAGYLGETYGWKYGFGLAGIGMLAGLLVFVWGKPMLNGAGEPPNPEALTRKRFAGLSAEWMIYIGTFIATIFIWWVVRGNILGTEVKTSVFQSLNAMYIVLLGPLFAALWVWLGKRAHQRPVQA